MKGLSLLAKLAQMFDSDNVVDWAVKDNKSRFIYVNKTFKIWHTISTLFNYEGLNIEDISVAVAEFADIF